jgi:chromosome partitioning protein
LNGPSAVINEKGGVGKTTTAVNLIACLVQGGQSGLLIDLDPQGNSSVHLGVNDLEAGDRLLRVLVDPKRTLEDLIVRTTCGVDIIPANRGLASAEIELGKEVAGHSLLALKLEALFKCRKWDHVLIDCPPSLGILTLNALCAARHVLIPVDTSYFGLAGLSKVMETIETVKDRVNSDLDVLGVLATRYKKSTKNSSEIYNAMFKSFGEKLFTTKINENIKLTESPSHGMPVITYAVKSQGSIDYHNFAKEYLVKVGVSSPGGISL